MIAYPHIDPVLLHIGPLRVRWYGLMYVLAFLGAYYILKRESERRSAPLSKEQVYDLLSYAAVGVILGGRLGYVLVYNLPYYTAHPLEILAVWKGGMSFHGGFLGVVVAGWWYCRKNSLPFWKLADFSVLPVPLGLFMGRMGNFINGELFGRPTDVPWCMVFPEGGPICRHPSQLYEGFMEGILLFAILYLLSRKIRPDGVIFWSFIGLYGFFRFVGEFFREPDPQLGLIFGPFSMGQLLSFPMALLGAAMVFRAYRTSRNKTGSSPAPS